MINTNIFFEWKSSENSLIPLESENTSFQNPVKNAKKKDLFRNAHTRRAAFIHPASGHKIQYDSYHYSPPLPNKDLRDKSLHRYISIFQKVFFVNSPAELDQFFPSPGTSNPKDEQENTVLFRDFRNIAEFFIKRKTSSKSIPAVEFYATDQTPFHALPPDIVLKIFHYSENEANIRLACKRFYQILSSHYDQNFYPKIFHDSGSSLSLFATALSKPLMANIEIIETIDDRISNLGILALLSGCMHLQTLRIVKGKQSQSGFISTEPFKLLGGKKLSLRLLSLEQSFSPSEILGEDLKNIGTVCPELRSLHISHRLTNKECFSHDNLCSNDDFLLFAAHCPKMENFQAGALVKLGQEFLNKLPTLFPHLIELDLSRSAVRDENVEALAAGWPRLKAIKLDLCAVTDRTLEILAGCAELTQASLRGCDKISKKALKEFTFFLNKDRLKN